MVDTMIKTESTFLGKWDEINMCYYDDDDEDEFYDNHKEGQKQSEHYEDFEYEKDDVLLEGESLDFANDPDIETI